MRVPQMIRVMPAAVAPLRRKAARVKMAVKKKGIGLIIISPVSGLTE